MNKTLLAVAALALSQAVPAQAENFTYRIDPTHTFVMWETKHFGVSTSRGRWDKTEGEISMDRAAKTGSVDVTIDMNSINTGVAPFNTHLKSPDFFDTANHPTARFVGKDMKFDGDRPVEVSGVLTMRGKSNPVTLKATGFGCYQHPRLKREVCGGDFEATIKRTLWDMNYGVANKVLADEIRVVIQVEAARQ